MASLVIGLVLAGLFAMAVVGFATRNVDDPRELTAWARAHGVELTTDNIGLVRYFVRLVVVLRVVGGLGGWLIGSLLDDAVGWRTSQGGGAWVWILCGWMAGAWWADRSVTPAPGPGAGASLAPRRLGDYLPRFLLVAPAGGAALAVVVAAFSMVGTSSGGANEWWNLVSAALAAVGIAAVAAVAQRSVVARPQPVLVPDLVAADDGVRATAVHHIGGGATAATLIIAGGLATQPGLAGPAGLRFGVFAVCVFGAIVAWRYWAFRAWRVRRPTSLGIGVGTAP